MRKIKTLFTLFLTMFKIGLFTFGGGYAMISIIQRELVERKKWLANDEFLDIVAIAESTPGPLAINSATYIGYKICGVLGSIFATLGVVIPSFVIIFVISLFFDEFMSLTYVQYAFKGIQVCVAFLIISAGIKMLKHLKVNPLNCILFSVTLILCVLFTLFSVNFSSIFYILAGGLLGLVIYIASYFKNKYKSKKEGKDKRIDNQAVDAEESVSEERTEGESKNADTP